MTLPTEKDSNDAGNFNERISSNMLVVTSFVDDDIMYLVVLRFVQYDTNTIPTDSKYVYTTMRCFVHRINKHRAATQPEIKIKY